MNQEVDKLFAMRHSAAHLLAHAITELFPGTILTIGPATEEGFFYDVLPTRNFKEEDLPVIEAKMHEIAKRGYPITGGQVPKDEARKLYVNNKFKNEIIESIPGETVGIYRQGDFFDLCKGGHVTSIDEIKYFALTGLAGSYWRADRTKDVLQRISGVAFLTQEDLDAYHKRVEDAKLYDHRRLGKQLDLFSFHEEAPGMVFFHPKGLQIYNALIDYSRKMQNADYQEIKTPIVLNEALWHQSGHYDNYRDNMYFTKTHDESCCVRPMNCPGSILVYNERPHSYRELPLRLSEYGLCHRYELSGVLHGILRVRAFTQDDAHIYCTMEQIVEEVMKVLTLANTMYKRFGFDNVTLVLTTRPEKSIGADEGWDYAIRSLQNALEQAGAPFTIKAGEGAFYGPKIEMHIQDALHRSWQCGTIQVDFFLPENFDMSYIDSDQSRKRPVIIHRAIYGSIERFLGVLLEHYKGAFPFWLAPVQARILVITDGQRSYAAEILQKLKQQNIRVEVDETGDQISAQIRRAQMDKIPWMLVLGKKEQEQQTVTLRDLAGKQEFGLTLDTLIERAQTLNQS